MNDSLVPQPEQATHATYKAGGGLVVQSLPDEVGIPVRRYQFDILCDGGIGEAKASRDVNIGVFAAAFAGLVGVLIAMDWDIVLAPGHLAKKVWLVVWTIVLLAMVVASATAICIYEARRKRTLTDSPYAREKTKLLKLYEAQEDSGGKLRDLIVKFETLAWIGDESNRLQKKRIVAQEIKSFCEMHPIDKHLLLTQHRADYIPLFSAIICWPDGGDCDLILQIERRYLPPGFAYYWLLDAVDAIKVKRCCNVRQLTAVSEWLKKLPDTKNEVADRIALV